MHVSHLRVVGLRNLAPLDLPLDARSVVFAGANGQGKTNLLEALYLAATGRSFRLSSNAEMVAHDRRQARVEVSVERQGARHDVVVELAGRTRHVVIDGRRGRHAHHLFQLVNVVAFFPDDLRIVKEGPERRRNFLDRAVANREPSFVAAALAYLRANQARNALLRQPRAPDRGLIAAYDAQLVRHGVAIDRARRRYLVRWRERAAAFVDRLLPELAGPSPALGLELARGVPAWGDDHDGAGAAAADDGARTAALEGAFASDLEASYPRDRARGFGHVGPHRGDLVVRLAGHPARQYASQGQQRAVVLCLKLAEVAILHAELGAAPVVLLDDISSELDADRTRLLFELVGEVAGQAFITTTGAEALPLPALTRRFAVAAGHVREAG